MKRLAVVGVAAVLAATGARAQVTQTYAYDGNGRLTGVSTTGGSGTNTASYAYDKADNRTQRVQSGSSSYAALTDLPFGGVLAPTQALVSPDGAHTFAWRPGRGLEVWRGDTPLWSWTQPGDGPRLSLAPDGAARLDAAFDVLPADARLSLADDGRLTFAAAGRPLWRSAALAQ